jgi:hypothetical protein
MYVERNDAAHVHGNVAKVHDATWISLHSFQQLLCPWIYRYPIPWPIGRLQKATAVKATLNPYRLNTTGIRNHEYKSKTPLVVPSVTLNATHRVCEVRPYEEMESTISSQYTQQPSGVSAATSKTHPLGGTPSLTHLINTARSKLKSGKYYYSC